MDSKGKFLVAFTFGAATGAAMGFLLAPRPGSEVRQGIAEWADHTRSRLKECNDAATEKARITSQWMKEKIQTISSSMGQRLKGKAEEMQAISDGGKS